jgi:hypothetical protein
MRSTVLAGNTGEICKNIRLNFFKVGATTSQFVLAYFWYDFMVFTITQNKSNGKK